MKEYDVKITETLEKTVTVQAESHDAAEEQVRAAYYNSEYILDSENFTGVAFGTTEEREVQKEQADTMNVLLVKPFMYPQAVQIGCELEDLQKAVGGDIEATYPFNEPVALVMHDEGKLVGKELNRALRDDDGDMPANLNRKQQREIKAVVERAKKDNGIPQTAQQSIPFQRMFPDGICRVTDSYYTKTIQFQDINYQLAQQEDKTAIFDEWCSFLNFFDSSIHFELSFMNLSTDAESFEKSIRIPFKKDSFNPVRAEYSQMLKKQLAQGNNGLKKPST